MKRILVYIGLCLVLTIPACSDDTFDSTLVADGIESGQDYSHIIEMAKEAFAGLHSGARSAEMAEVASVTPWLTRQIYAGQTNLSRAGVRILPDTLLYIVNFADKAGCVLVADNDEIQGPVAILPRQNLYPTEYTGENNGFKLYMDMFRDAYLNGTLGDQIFSDSLDKSLRDSLLNPNLKWITTDSIRPSVKQQWGQKSPFNYFCLTGSGEQAVAGCVPVAIGELLAHYKYPDAINNYKIEWEKLQGDFPYGAEDQKMASRLIHELGVISKVKYGVKYSSTSVGNMKAALDSLKLKYKHEGHITDLLLRYIMKNYGPALLYGAPKDNPLKGHEWIIDGFLTQIRFSNNQVRYMIYCNWGDYGNKNGYYLTNAFNPSGIDSISDIYSYNLQVTYLTEPPGN